MALVRWWTNKSRENCLCGWKEIDLPMFCFWKLLSLARLLLLCSFWFPFRHHSAGLSQTSSLHLNENKVQPLFFFSEPLTGPAAMTPGLSSIDNYGFSSANARRSRPLNVLPRSLLAHQDTPGCTRLSPPHSLATVPTQQSFPVNKDKVVFSGKPVSRAWLTCIDFTLLICEEELLR